MEPQVWSLFRGRELLAEIVVADVDMPWSTGRVIARAGLAEFRPVFEREIALVDAPGELDYEAWERAYEPISELTLESPTGPVGDFLLHIDGDEARFRWSDDPDEA